MTSQPSDVDRSANRKRDPRAALARWRRGRVVKIFSIFAMVAALAVGWVLYHRPAHPYQMSAHNAVWTADVKFALSESRSGSPVPILGPLRDIPGVGKIVKVIVEKFPSRKGSAVLFLTGVSIGYQGLVYLDGYPPPPDSCNVHLSGPWWEVSPENVATMGCARGFHFTAGG